MTDERDDELELEQPEVPEQDEELLKEIRDRYTYFDSAWREIRDESRKDRKFLSGDPWDEEDRKAREDNGRPCISHDELTQYVNVAVNNVRQNKRGIRVEPDGHGANEQTAELHQDLIRTIEYRSSASSAYVTGYECALQGSYGWFRISRRYQPRSFHQEIVIKNVANPDSVLYDPDCKEADWSDAKACFVLDPMSKDEFKRRYPKAQIKDFSAEHTAIAKDWLQNDQVLVAEYWKVETDLVRICLLADGTTVDFSEVPKGARVVNSRKEERRTVCQYITNGVEILERRPQPGELLPIIPVIGKELYLDEGGTPKRKLFSLVRLARDPQMSMAYLVTQQMEEAGLSPKVPYIGYKGQFDSDRDAWENLHRVPRSYVQVDPTTESTGGQILPLPQRVPFTPNFAAYEVAKDSCRRAIQAALGINPLPTSAQRQNEKSGVALERIEAQQDLGSFHFLDNLERAIAYAGRVVESWIPVVYDTQRELALRKADDSHRFVTINTPAPYTDPRTQETQHYPITDDVDHYITTGSGPSYASQREEAADFLDTLIKSMPNLPVPPAAQAKLLSLAIQMRQLGPKGDEMAELISPDPQGNMSPQAMAQIQQAQAQLQQTGMVIQELQAELQKLQMERQARVIDNQYRMELEKLKIEAQLAMAEIGTKAQQLSERQAFVQDAWSQLHDQAHEVGMAAEDRAHERDMAAQGAAADQQAQASDQMHEAGMAASGAAADQQAQQAEHMHQAGMAQYQAANQPQGGGPKRPQRGAPAAPAGERFDPEASPLHPSMFQPHHYERIAQLLAGLNGRAA
jgi:hypothetical protein